jgi:hypothetical protein
MFEVFGHLVMTMIINGLDCRKGSQETICLMERRPQGWFHGPWGNIKGETLYDGEENCPAGRSVLISPGSMRDLCIASARGPGRGGHQDRAHRNRGLERRYFP